MDIYPSGINVPNEPKGGFGKPVTNKGYTPGTFGVTVDKKPAPKEVVSFVPNVGREVRNPETEELLRLGRLAKKEGFGFTTNEKGEVVEVTIPTDWAGDTENLQEQLEKKEGESVILKKVITLSGEFTASNKEAELLKPKLQNPSTVAVLETVSNEIKKLIDDIQRAPESIKVDELVQKLQEFHKAVERAKTEVAKVQPSIETNSAASVSPEKTSTLQEDKVTAAVPTETPPVTERINTIPKFFEIGQTFLLPKDDDHKGAEEAHWEVIELISKDGAMIMKQVDGNQKGRKERFYYKQLKGFLERIEKEKQYGLKRPQELKVVADQSTEKKTPAEAPKTSPEVSAKPSVLRPTAFPKKIERSEELSAEQNAQKILARTEIRAKFEDMFARDQQAFISLYTTANKVGDTTTYTENEDLKKHPYRDVIRNIFFAHNISVTELVRKENIPTNIQQKNSFISNKLVYGPSTLKEAESKKDTRTEEEKLHSDLTTNSVREMLSNSMGEGMVTPDKVVASKMASNNEPKEIIPALEKDPQAGLKKISAILAARIKNLSNNPNNLLRGKLSWIAFAVAVGGAGALTTSYLKNLEEKGSVPVSESLNKNEKEVKDTWTKYFHFGKTNLAFAEFPEDISKLSANQLKETLIQKYAKSYFDGTNNQRQNLLALGMFGDLVRDDVTKGTYDHLSEKARAELSYLWDALNDVSVATSGEKLQAKTYEAAIEEVKEKVTNREA